MARTLDPSSHAVRRDAFLDVAQRLMLAKGYDGFSIQDVLDQTSASKGAFYHYFGGKADLLEAIVERMAEAVERDWAEILDRPDLDAVGRFHAVFASTARYKNERRDLTLAILEGWLAESNTVLREKLRDLVARRMTPVLVRILREGIDDGEFTATSPDGTAHVIVALIQGIQEEASRLFVRRQRGEVTIHEIERLFAAFQEALDRLLGLRPGRLSLVDPPTLRLWFG